MQRSLAFTGPCGGAPVPGVVLYGLGAIGLEVARRLVESTEWPIIAAVDADPAKVGRSLAELTGLDSAPPVAVARELPAEAPPGAVALHMAGSRLPTVEPQLVELIEAGYSVASSAEELCYPQLRHPEAAARLDALARQKGVAVAGVGVNPGFLMDLLPLVASTVCLDVERVEVERIVDAATRREPLQRKVGAGMTPEQFEALADREEIGHVGLMESCALLADGLGLAADRIEEELKPALAERQIRTDYFEVAPGQVAGIIQEVRAMEGETVRAKLHLEMYLGAPDPRDEVRIVGRPELRLVIPGGTPGDSATVAALVNAIPRVAAAPPGLHTPKDLPLTG